MLVSWFDMNRPPFVALQQRCRLTTCCGTYTGLAHFSLLLLTPNTALPAADATCRRLTVQQVQTNDLCFQSCLLIILLTVAKVSACCRASMTAASFSGRMSMTPHLWLPVHLQVRVKPFAFASVLGGTGTMHQVNASALPLQLTHQLLTHGPMPVNLMHALLACMADE